MARIIGIREIGQTIGAIAGGEVVHFSNPGIGGMYRNVSPGQSKK
jgi:coenzyme F420 hydrogenase subunit alpha